jgi:hypothetical protein
VTGFPMSVDQASPQETRSRAEEDAQEAGTAEMVAEDLLWTARHLAWNPVATSLAGDPFASHWSSAGRSQASSAPRLRPELGELQTACGGGPDWRRRYRELIEQVNGSEVRRGDATKPTPGLERGPPSLRALIRSRGRSPLVARSRIAPQNRRDLGVVPSHVVQLIEPSSGRLSAETAVWS